MRATQALVDQPPGYAPAMRLRQVLPGVPDSAGEVEITGLAYDNRAVRARNAVLLRPGVHARRPRVRAGCDRPGRGGAGRGAPAEPGRPGDQGAERPGGDGAGRGGVLRRPDRDPADGRGHRHQRQDHDGVSGPRAARGRRPPDRAAGHGQERDRRRRARRGAHDARGDRPAADVPRDARRGRRRVRDGGLLARARAPPGRRDPLRGGDLHEPDPGPPRLPRDDGGVLPGQAAAVRRRAGRGTP